MDVQTGSDETEQTRAAFTSITNHEAIGDMVVEQPKIPAGYDIPHGWKCTTDGILRTTTGKDGGTRDQRIAYGPILPIAVRIDHDGNQLVELTWRSRGRWTTRTVPRSATKAGKKLIALLGDAGLPAVESDAKGLEMWLAAVERANEDLIPEKKLPRWLGWQPDGEFIANAEDCLVEPVYKEQVGALRAHKRSGSLEHWQRAMLRIEHLPVAKMALYAGLAPALLDALGLNSTTVDLSGRSTRGKTTAARIAASCWFDPSEGADGIAAWNTGIISIEKRLNLVRGLPVVLDETRMLKSHDIVDKVLYRVPKDRGDSRGGGWPTDLPWSTIVISTGEQCILTFTTHGGASARVLAITKPPFGEGNAENGAAAKAVSDAIVEHYGHAGPEFVSCLQRMLAEPEGREHLREWHRALTQEVRGPNELSARRAPAVALLRLAAELCHAWNVVPGLTVPPLNVWLDVFVTNEATDDRPGMALDIVREFVAANGSALWRPGERFERPQPMRGWIGRTVKVGDDVAVALLPSRLREELRRVGVEIDTVLPAWKENGTLVRTGNEKAHSFDRKERLGSSQPRMFTFHPAAVEVYAEEPNDLQAAVRDEAA